MTTDETLEKMFCEKYAEQLRANKEQPFTQAGCDAYLNKLREEIQQLVKKHGTNGDGYSVKLPENILGWEGKGCNARTELDAKTLMYYAALRKQKIEAPEPEARELVTQTGTTDSDIVSLRTSVRVRKAKAQQTGWDPKWDPWGDKEPRPYQRESVERLMKESLLINMPTGSGKTLVAVMAANYFMAMDDKRLVAFFVPTRALVEQQAQYMRNYCRVNGKQIDPEMVREVAGMEVGDWDKITWRNTINNARILVGTPEVFRASMCDTHYISPQDFSLLIFDEAHHSVGNSPMANILRRVKEVDNNEFRPHRLGLTGSWLNGALRNADEKLRTLLNLMEAEMFVPDIDPALLGSEPIYKQLSYAEADNIETLQQLVTDITLSVLDGLEAICKDSDKAKRRSTNVFKQLGFEGWRFFMRYGLIEEAKHQAKNHLKSNCMKQLALKKLMELDVISKEVEGRWKTQNKQIEDLAKAAPSFSGKVAILLALLTDFFEKTQDARVIVFVEEVSVCLPLMYIINQKVQDPSLKVKDVPIATYSSGVSSMEDEARQANIKGFKEGKYKIMVATASLEEGLDVAACNHVIAYDGIATVKSHIQKTGRARADNAHIWYFENDPEVEKQKALEMQKTAHRLQEDPHSKKPKAQFARKYEFKFGYYPYEDPSSGMTIQLLNCKTIFHEYAQAVFRQEISPFEMLYTWGEDKHVLKVRIPTPRGVKEMGEKEVVDIWGSDPVCNDPKALFILHPEAKKEMKATEWEMRKFVMAAVIWLQREGHMQDNKASENAKFNTRTHPECLALLPKEKQTKFRNNYGTSAQANAQSTKPPPQIHGYGAAQANAENTDATPSPAPSSQTRSKNLKGRLTETMQRLLRVPLKKDSIVFCSTKHPQGWLSTVTLRFREGVDPEVFCGTDPRESKRDAEEDVAYIALSAKNADRFDELMADAPKAAKVNTASTVSPPDVSKKCHARPTPTPTPTPTPIPAPTEDSLSAAETARSVDDDACTCVSVKSQPCTTPTPVNPENSTSAVETARAVDDKTYADVSAKPQPRATTSCDDDTMSMKTCLSAAFTCVPTPTKDVARMGARGEGTSDKKSVVVPAPACATTLSSVNESGESVQGSAVSRDEDVRTQKSEESERESADDTMLVEVNLCHNGKKRKVNIPGTRTVGEVKLEKMPSRLKGTEDVVLQDEDGRELDDSITLAQLQRERSRGRPLELEFTVNDW